MSDWIDSPKEIRKGEELDVENLKDHLRKNIEGLSETIEVSQFPGGYSNLTYLIKFEEKEFVLRKPPHGANIKSGHDMGREFKILSRLWETFPKAPKAVHYCKDTTIIGSEFYLAERMKGIILRYGMPKEMFPEPKAMSQISKNWIDTLVELHEVDYESVGLGDLGRPEGYIERQVGGWTKRYFNAKTDELPKLESAAKWLSENMPLPSKPTLIHNDFKYDNVVLNVANGKEIIGVLDWEMATIGDPLMDLGTSLGYWVSPSDPDFMRAMQLNPSHLPGNPTREEIVQSYAANAGRDVGDGVFYYVFGLFKISVIAQQIYARYKAGLTQDQRFASLIDGVKAIGEIADRVIERKKLDNLF